MNTIENYNKSFEKTKKKVMNLTKDFTEMDRIALAYELKMSSMTIRNYCLGKGTNIRTYLVILDKLNSHLK